MATQSEQVAAAPLVGGSGTTLHSHQTFPVGAVFIAVVNTDPATLLGYGTWSQIAGGRVLIGQTSGDVDFDTAEEMGGAKSITGLRKGGTSGAATLTDSHSLMNPYFVVYIWKRTA